MLQKTNGIVLRTTNYSESSIITKICTEKFGLQTYIVNGVRSARSKGKAALYQHGNILEMVVYYRETGNIFRISEAKIALIYKEIPFHIVKSSLLLFCVEVLNKTIKDHVVQEEVFRFAERAFNYLDCTTNPLSNFHIAYLIELSKLFGFAPTTDTGKYFDLQEGVFSYTIPHHTNYLPEDSAKHLKTFLLHSLDQSHTIALTSNERKVLLNYLILYFKLHVAEFGQLYSPDILSEVLNTDGPKSGAIH